MSMGATGQRAESATEDTIAFSDFLDPSRWRTLRDHVASIDAELDADLRVLSEEEQRLEAELRPMLEKEYGVRTVDDVALAEARQTLYGSKVCAVDGTNSVFPLRGGLRVRVGVASITYSNRRHESVFYISEQQVRSPDLEPLQLLAERRADAAVISSMVVRCLMAYKEREIALDRQEEWKFLNGSVFPQELRTGLGKLRALEPCLALAKRVAEAGKFVGVVGSSSHNDLVTLGMALKTGEYLRLWSLKKDLDDWLSRAHFNPGDHARFQTFIDECGDKIDVGVYRAGARAYVFQCSAADFDRGAALVMADSLHQPLRGYPLLIDYADAICTRMLAARDFQRQVAYRLARGGKLASEADELSLRRR